MSIVNDLAEMNCLADREMLRVRLKVREALFAAFGAVDSGVGGCQCDFWIQDGDVEYKIVMTPCRSLKATQ